MKTRWYMIFFLLYPLACFSQNGDASMCKVWCPTSLSGGIKLGGQYRYEKGVTNQIYEYQKSPLIYGGILLNSSSYIYHPNLLTLDLSAEYNPEKRQDIYLVVPDQSEVRTIKRLNINTTMFKQKEFTIGAFANFNESYTNRENLSNLKVTSNNWGTNLLYGNKILPVSISYQEGITKEKEVQTDRSFNSRQCNFLTSVTKSFTSLDNNELNYSHNTFSRIDYNLFEIKNATDIVNLNNSIYFDRKRNYSFTSNISGTRQKGYDNYNSLQIFENSTMKLTKSLTAGANYSFYNIEREIQKINQNNLNFFLRHQLFKSLFTDLTFEYGKLDQSVYQEINKKAGIDLRYEKDIPKGHLSLSYSFSRLNQNRKSSSALLPVINEQHILTDGQIVLLRKPYIVQGSVIVKDFTGTIIYQEYFDYTLIERNNYKEIQRVPGGQIANNSVVYVDYVANQQGSYQFDSDFQRFTANITLFERLVEVYYRWSNQDYSNIETSDFQMMNYFTQNIVGSRFEYKFASAGVEYDDYESNIIPYRLLRFFALLQGNFKNRLLFSLNGNLRNYKMIDDMTNQQYSDLSGNVAYLFTPQTKLNVELGYRKQIGSGIDLDFLTFRSEFTANYRQLFFKVGVEFYQRNYLNEEVNFVGANIEVIRKFNWYR